MENSKDNEDKPNKNVFLDDEDTGLDYSLEQSNLETGILRKSEIAYSVIKHAFSPKRKANSSENLIKRQKSNGAKYESIKNSADKITAKCIRKVSKVGVTSIEESRANISAEHPKKDFPFHIPVVPDKCTSTEYKTNICQESKGSDLNDATSISARDKGETMLAGNQKYNYTSYDRKEIQQMHGTNPKIHSNLGNDCDRTEFASKYFFSRLVGDISSKLQNKSLYSEKPTGSSFLENKHFNYNKEHLGISCDKENNQCLDELKAKSSYFSNILAETRQQTAKSLNSDVLLSELPVETHYEEGFDNNSICIEDEVFSNVPNWANAYPEIGNHLDTLSIRDACRQLSFQEASIYLQNTINVLETLYDPEMSISNLAGYKCIDFDIDKINEENKNFAFQNNNFSTKLPDTDSESSEGDYVPPWERDLSTDDVVFAPEGRNYSNHGNSSMTQHIMSPPASPMRVPEEFSSETRNVHISQDGASTSKEYDQNAKDGSERDDSIGKCEMGESSENAHCPFALPKNIEVKKDRFYQKRFYRLKREGKLHTLLEGNLVEQNFISFPNLEANLEQDSSESEEKCMLESNESANQRQFNICRGMVARGRKSINRNRRPHVRDKEGQSFCPAPLNRFDCRRFGYLFDSPKETDNEDNSFDESLNRSFETANTNDQSPLLCEIAQLGPKKYVNLSGKSHDKCYYLQVQFNFNDFYTGSDVIFLRDKLYEPFQSEKTSIPLRPLFRVLDTICVEREELSIEELLFNLLDLKLMYHKKKNFEGCGTITERHVIKICKIPIIGEAETDEDCELAEDNLVPSSFIRIQNDEASQTERFQESTRNESEVISKSCTDDCVSEAANSESISEDNLRLEKEKLEDNN